MKHALLTIFLCGTFLGGCKKDQLLQHQLKKRDIAWMAALMDEFPQADITLSDLCVPGSHDTGMSLVRECTFGANSCNTQTQHLDMKGQLEAGMRVFDVRPILFKSRYYTQHATACDGMGCKGELMEDILSDTRVFLDAYPEVVILLMGHFCNMSGNDEAFLQLLSEKLGDRIYREKGASRPLYQRSLREDILADAEPGTGKVILQFEEGFSNTAENRAKGYFTNDVIPFEGGWSDKNNYPQLKEDQLLRYQNYVNDGKKLFQFSWHMTQDAKQAVSCALLDNTNSIESFSVITNNALPGVIDSLISIGAINRARIPNLIWVDYGNEQITDECIKISRLALR